MLHRTRTLLNTAAASAFRRFARDERGVAQLEFAFILPFLLAAWLGMGTILQTEDVTTRVGKVSATIADMISQAPEVDAAFIDGTFKAADAMLADVPMEGFSVVVAGLEIHNDGTYTTLWECTRQFGSGGGATTAQITVPSYITDAPGFIVASAAKYKHTPIYGASLNGEHTYEYNNYFVPRQSPRTSLTGNNSNPSANCPANP